MNFEHEIKHISKNKSSDVYSATKLNNRYNVVFNSYGLKTIVYIETLWSKEDVYAIKVGVMILKNSKSE